MSTVYETELGMFFEAQPADRFPLGQAVEVYAMGSWYRGVVVQPVTPKRKRLGVRYQSGAGAERVKHVRIDADGLGPINPYGRQRHGNPSVRALGVRIPAALADVREAVEEAKPEKVEQAQVAQGDVLKAVQTFDHEHMVRVAAGVVTGRTDAMKRTWDDYSSTIDPANVARYLGVEPRTHGASIRRELGKLAKAGQLRVAKNGRTKCYSSILTAEQAEAAVQAILDQAHIHEMPTAALAAYNVMHDAWWNARHESAEARSAAYEAFKAHEAELRSRVEQAARDAGKRYVWILKNKSDHGWWITGPDGNGPDLEHAELVAGLPGRGRSA